jgi:hypothetical protein
MAVAGTGETCRSRYRIRARGDVRGTENLANPSSPRNPELCA